MNLSNRRRECFEMHDFQNALFKYIYGGYAENIIIRRHLLLINGTLIVKFEEKASFMEDEQFCFRYH